MTRALFAILAICCMLWLPVQAQTPMQWIQRMERGERTVALEGVRVTQFLLPVPLPPVEERIVRVGIRYRVEYLQPPPRRGEVLIDDGVRRFHHIPRLNRVLEMPSDQPLILRRRRELIQRLRSGELRLSVKGEETIAGRRATLIETFTAQGQPLPRLWIDREYGVILRMEELTPRGELRMRTEYVQIKLPAEVPMDNFVPHFPPQAQRRVVLPPSQVFTRVEDAQPLVGFSIRQPRELPKGFRLTEVRMRILRQRPLVSLYYTDGASSVTLFQTRIPLRSEAPLLKTLASVASHVEQWEEGGIYFVLLGDADPTVFQQIRKAMR